MTTTAASPSAPRRGLPDPSDAVAWHRRLCPVGDRIVISGDLPDGERAAVAHLNRWVDAGITGIVDCRLEWSDEALVAEFAPQVRYVHVGVDDDGSRRSDDWFDEGVSGALALLALTDGDVLVHCHMGINRGPSMAFAVLLALGWQPLAALGAIRAARPIAAISYADDALAWWARTQGLSATEVQALRRGVRRWERANDLDPGTVIRQIRLAS